MYRDEIMHRIKWCRRKNKSNGMHRNYMKHRIKNEM